MSEYKTIICRKCGAVGTHHCSMRGCPLPELPQPKNHNAEVTQGPVVRVNTDIPETRGNP